MSLSDVFLGFKCVGIDDSCTRRTREEPEGLRGGSSFEYKVQDYGRVYVDGPLCKECLILATGRQERWNAQLKAPECPYCHEDMINASPFMGYLIWNVMRYNKMPNWHCRNCGVDGNKLPGQLAKAKAGLKKAVEKHDADTKRALSEIATIKSRLKKGLT